MKGLWLEGGNIDVSPYSAKRTRAILHSDPELYEGVVCVPVTRGLGQLSGPLAVVVGTFDL